MTEALNRTGHTEKAPSNVDSAIRKKGSATVPLYSSKIIKAGALISDTKAFFTAWAPELSVNENLQRVRRKNLMGKTSRSRAEDILAIFRQRYLAEEDVAQALATIVKRQSLSASRTRQAGNGNTLDRILYFHAARADALLHDVVIEQLVPQWSKGIMEIDNNEVESTLKKWVEEGKTSAPWGNSTIRRVTQGVLSTLRDFGVLQGAVNKRIAPAYLSVQAFAYIAFYLKQHQPSGAKLIDLVDWKLFFLSREGTERFLLEAHQHGLLEYHVAGSVTRLTFPTETLEEYTNVILQQSN